MQHEGPLTEGFHVFHVLMIVVAKKTLCHHIVWVSSIFGVFIFFYILAFVARVTFADGFTTCLVCQSTSTCRTQNPDIPRAGRVGAPGGAAGRGRSR